MSTFDSLCVRLCFRWTNIVLRIVTGLAAVFYLTKNTGSNVDWPRVCCPKLDLACGHFVYNTLVRIMIASADKFVVIQLTCF